MKPELIFVTEPHGEHTLYKVEPSVHGDSVANAIFAMNDSTGKRLAFTGEELTSLAQQWLAYLVRQK